MPNTVLSVYMNLPVPVPTVDPGPQYAFDLNSCLALIDSHTHAPGQGQQITPAGINITTDLSFGGNNAINLRSSRYTIQGGALAAGSDVGCTYVTGVDLYYNDINGNQIRLTQNGGVAGTPGSIANLLPPASVTYVTGTQTFVFQSSTATAGNIDVGSVKIREVAANANAVTLSSPSSLPANYTLTFPSALNSSTASIVKVDQSGNLSFIPSSTAATLTEWTAFTPSYTSEGGATSIGDGTLTGWYKIVSDNLNVRVDFVAGTTTTYGVGTLVFGLPSAYKIDVSKTPSAVSFQVLGNAQALAGGNQVPGFSVYQSTSAVRAHYFSGFAPANYNNPVSGLAPGTFGAGDKISLQYQVPFI